MKPDYTKLLKEHNISSMLLDEKGCVNAMDICYETGKEDGNIEVLEWLSKMDYLSDNIQYIIEEWKNQNKI